jgi:hypothetical protein
VGVRDNVTRLERDDLLFRCRHWPGTLLCARHLQRGDYLNGYATFVGCVVVGAGGSLPVGHQLLAWSWNLEGVDEAARDFLAALSLEDRLAAPKSSRRG